MFKAISAFFNMFILFCGAGEKVAMSADKLATVAYNKADGFEKLSRVEQQQALDAALKATGYKLDKDGNPVAMTKEELEEANKT